MLVLLFMTTQCPQKPAAKQVPQSVIGSVDAENLRPRILDTITVLRERCALM